MLKESLNKSLLLKNKILLISLILFYVLSFLFVVLISKSNASVASDTKAAILIKYEKLRPDANVKPEDILKQQFLRLRISPNKVVFDKDHIVCEVGQTCSAAVKIYNYGDEQVNISLSLSGDSVFALNTERTTCSSLNPNEECIVWVDFSPTDVIVYHSQLLINDRLKVDIVGQTVTDIQFCGGSGTIDDPYQICNVGSFYNLLRFVNRFMYSSYCPQDVTTYYFVITNDIDLERIPYDLGEFSTASIYCQTAVLSLDGQNHVIKNFVISTDSDAFLVPPVGGGQIIKNLRLENIKLETSDSQSIASLFYGTFISTGAAIISRYENIVVDGFEINSRISSLITKAVDVATFRNLTFKNVVIDSNGSADGVFFGLTSTARAVRTGDFTFENIDLDIKFKNVRLIYGALSSVNLSTNSGLRIENFHAKFEAYSEPLLGLSYLRGLGWIGGSNTYSFDPATSIEIRNVRIDIQNLLADENYYLVGGFIVKKSDALADQLLATIENVEISTNYYNATNGKVHYPLFGVIGLDGVRLELRNIALVVPATGALFGTWQSTISNSTGFASSILIDNLYHYGRVQISSGSFDLYNSTSPDTSAFDTSSVLYYATSVDGSNQYVPFKLTTITTTGLSDSEFQDLNNFPTFDTAIWSVDSKVPYIIDLGPIFE